jgi:hypothetical protein
MGLNAEAVGLTRLRDFLWEHYVPVDPPAPAPAATVVNRERDERGEMRDWVLVSTSPRRSAAEIRGLYDPRPAIEERHRQYKCFWDLTRMHSCAFSLVVNQSRFAANCETQSGASTGSNTPY